MEKSIPMKQEQELRACPPGKMLLKLTIFGCFLLGFAYVSILLLNTAFQAIH
jgi:hypothetical protein